MRIAVTPGMKPVKNDLLHAVADTLCGDKELASDAIGAVEEVGCGIYDKREPVRTDDGGRVYLHTRDWQVARDMYQGFISCAVAGEVFLLTRQEAGELGAALLSAADESLADSGSES